MTETDQIIDPKFASLTVIKRGHMTSHLPRKFAETNANMAAGVKKKQEAKGVRS